MSDHDHLRIFNPDATAEEASEAAGGYHADSVRLADLADDDLNAEQRALIDFALECCEYHERHTVRLVAAVACHLARLRDGSHQADGGRSNGAAEVD